jgi:protein-S-isoprenylcysteine O-methyltransferase Ste14
LADDLPTYCGAVVGNQSCCIRNGEEMGPYVRIFVILAGFGVFHSLSAREAVKGAILSKVRVPRPAYAAVRTSISLTLLILSLYFLFQQDQTTRPLFPPIYGLSAIVPAMFAFWIAGMAFGQVAKGGRLPQVFGLQEYPKVFFFSGAYSVCRHPMYAGWLIASWGLVLSKPYLLTVFYNLLLTVYVVFESLQEEKQMLALFGDRYRTYRKKIPFLIPYGFLRRDIRQEGLPRT